MTEETGKPKLIEFNGQQVRAIPVEITRRAEGPSTYTLADGSSFEVTLKVIDLCMLEGKKNANGEQVFHFGFSVSAKHRTTNEAQ